VRTSPPQPAAAAPPMVAGIDDEYSKMRDDIAAELLTLAGENR
jgi:hypothetical protein